VSLKTTSGCRWASLGRERFACSPVAGDPGCTDQIILGAPRNYEVSASFKW
jgi:hypothetical protein